jgi:hypothetical protein
MVAAQVLEPQLPVPRDGAIVALYASIFDPTLLAANGQPTNQWLPNLIRFRLTINNESPTGYFFLPAPMIVGTEEHPREDLIIPVRVADDVKVAAWNDSVYAAPIFVRLGAGFCDENDLKLAGF